MTQLLQTINRVKKNINPNLKIEGTLLTMVDNRTNFAKDISYMLRSNYGDKLRVFKTEIPLAIKAAETSAEGKSIYTHDAHGKAATAYIAKNIVAAGLADKCELQLSYSIGLADPVSMRVETFGTERIPLDKLCKVVQRSVDCRPEAIIERFGLKRPIFSRVSCYGHFGANAGATPWEATDLAFKL